MQDHEHHRRQLAPAPALEGVTAARALTDSQARAELATYTNREIRELISTMEDQVAVTTALSLPSTVVSTPAARLLLCLLKGGGRADH